MGQLKVLRASALAMLLGALLVPPLSGTAVTLPFREGDGSARPTGVTLAPVSPQIYPDLGLDPAVASLFRLPTEEQPPTVPLVLFLENQPTFRLASEFRASLAEAWSPYISTARTAAAPDGIASVSSSPLEKLVWEHRSELLSKAWSEMEASRAVVVSDLEIRGVGAAYRGRLFNTLTVKAPLEIVPRLAQHPGVAAVYLDSPLTGGLAISALALGTDSWWSKSFNGTPWDVAVVDTGIDFTHPSLVEGPAKVFHREGRLDPFYGDRADRTDDFHGHGTHIAGIVASQNLTNRGVAFGVRDLINAKFGFRTLLGGSRGYWSDAMEAIDWAVAEAGADVISFSFGDADNGDGESGFTRYLDAVVDVLGVPVVIGASNFGPGENTVGTPADAYNGITVGNMNDYRTPSRGDDDLHPASGWGPTGDGRGKPDLVAPGTSIASTSHQWETGPDFVTMTGTSMATPHVAAAVSLLLGFLGEPVFPALHKALLLNAADDRGPPGFDVRFGWGYVNLTRAFEQRDRSVVANLSDERPFRLYTVGMGEDDRATLAWQRHVFVGGLGSTDFFADLDLEAYLAETHERLASSNSTSENVEQVAPGGPRRPTVLKVITDSPLEIGERFALAASQSLSEVRPPRLEADVALPCAVVTGDEFDVTASIRNGGDLSARNLSFSVAESAGLDLVEGAMNGSFASVQAGEEQAVRWRFRALSEGEWSLSLNVSGVAFGEPLSAVAQGTVFVQAISSPFVREFGVFPGVQGIGEEVLFEATICAGAGIGEAHWALLAAEGTEVSNQSMEGGSDPSRFSYRQTFWTLGTHMFRIAGREAGGLWVTVEGSFTILDRRAPDIFQPVVLPPVSEWGAPIRVRAQVLDNSTIESVGVSIALLGEPEDTNIPLLPTSGGHWEAQMTPQKPGTHTAVISATDAVGITGTATLTFRVVEGVPPIAGIDGPSEAQTDTPVTFSAHPSSDDFGIASFSWIIDGPGESGEKVTGEGETMEHTFTQPGSYRVILLVNDLAGNLGLAEERVRVQASVAPSSFPPWVPYVVLVPAVILGVWLWIWRRKAR